MSEKSHKMRTLIIRWFTNTDNTASTETDTDFSLNGVTEVWTFCDIF